MTVLYQGSTSLENKKVVLRKLIIIIIINRA